MATSGQPVEAGDIQVTNARVTSVLGTDANVETVLVTNKAILRDATQKIVDNFPRGKDPRNVAVKKVDGRWLVQAFLR